jgi:hypothetical protein
MDHTLDKLRRIPENLDEGKSANDYKVNRFDFKSKLWEETAQDPWPTIRIGV